MELDEALTALRSATAGVARALGEMDLSSLTREQLLSVVEETHRASNVLAGVETVAVAHVAAVEDVVDQHGQWGQQHRGLGHRALDAPELVGPTLGITVQAAATRVEVAIHQVTTTPALVGQMLAGDLDAWRARVVTTEVEPCPEDGAAVIVDALVGHYEARGGWDETTGPLRARVRRMVARAHPELVAKQAKEAREGRSVRRSPATMGTDHWEAELPVESSTLMWQAVETLARTLRRQDPDLTLAQARADALAQLVLARADATVHLHATVPTEDAPTDTRAQSSRSGGPQLTEVSGLGSTTPTLVDLDALGESASVVPSTRLVCDSDTGAVVGGGVPASLAKRARRDAARRNDGYVVPPDMARLVRLRDGRCRFPSCSINAIYTDQDHVIPWPVGATTPTNLMCLCRRHHRIKQRHGWSVRLDPDGTAHWSDPAGRPWVTHPVDHLDRAIVPGASAVPPDVRAARPTTAHCPTVGGKSQIRLLGLDEIPSLLEDQLRRCLELAVLTGPPPTITVACPTQYPAAPPF
ncbi:HNH endonuclease [Knoellia sp. CPCC 206435]|uniref:HNH endonuclease signature motif containing protein n=1 Tax=Knoellia terrae TaxID=3404797 RepID=UPI003B43D5D6